MYEYKNQNQSSSKNMSLINIYKENILNIIYIMSVKYRNGSIKIKYVS